MNPLNLAVLLISTSSFVSASASLLDKRNEYKISLLNDPQLTNVFGTLNDHNRFLEFEPKYAEVKRLFREKKAEAIEALNNETKGLNEITEKTPFNTIYFSQVTSSCGRNVVDTAKKEWDLREAALNAISNRYLTKKELPSQIDMLQTERETAISNLNRECSDKSITNCYSRNPYEIYRVLDPVKKWAYAQEIYGDSSALRSGTWIKPDWKPLLRLISGANTRFVVAPVQKDLNLISLWEDNGKDLTAAIATLRANLATVRAGLPRTETELRADFTFRTNVLSAIVSPSKDTPLVDLDVIARRVKAFERIVEGLVRLSQSAVDVKVEEADMAVKAWLMCVQMFVQKGFEDDNVKLFATVAVPSGVSLSSIAKETPSVDAAKTVPEAPIAPVVVAEPAVGQIRPRSDSGSIPTTNGSSDSFNVPEPKKRFFGLF